MIAEGVSLISITGGNPYYNPHVNRPYDKGPYVIPKNQLYNIEKMINATREIKQASRGAVFVCAALTWLREYALNVGEATIREKYFDIMGLGRQALAYPDFPIDIIKEEKMQRMKCCITSGKCTELMRNGNVSGCVIRDSDIYAPIYKKAITNLQKSSLYIQEHIY